MTLLFFRENKMLSVFSKNVLSLVSGTTIAQILPVIIIPIITRIYTPEDLGLLAIVVSILSILSIVANGRYELAINLPEKSDDAARVIAVSLIICTLFSIIVFFISSIFGNFFIERLGLKYISWSIYVIPVMMWLSGIYNVLNYANVRIGKFKDIALSTIKKAAGLSILQVVLGYFGFGALGLILSQIAFLLLGNKTLISNVLRQYSFTKLTMSELKKTAKRYRAFFLLSLPAALANALVTHLTTLMISVYFNIATLGLYSLTQKVLGIPSSFLGNAVFQVLLKEGCEEKKKTGAMINTFDSTLKKLLIIGLPFFIFIYMAVEPAFEFFFGHEWLIAGLYAKISIPLFAARFIVSSLSAVDTICEKQHLFLIFNLVLLIVTVMIFFIFKSSDFITFLYCFSYSNALVYILYGFVLRYVAKCQK
ncbi:oligosaccharide flippase family protein [Vibrio cholerae]|uniref:oligosaccharide flippase family protein n=1 Tax=Vibrio cholerae TaxID=666 RepID=UPI00287B4BDF|nr:oligosaccharide flippase family protein [Vibrio cholerae]EGR4264304.1 hypothetical protein [Vibrio cholerae]EJH4016457.1 oligosaccharide flippase family protein [Vibrio cholerae]EJH4017511.1 oligosaccharide flippase family protein [Vibrio cholerae]EKF9092040.1 oligosaccharide flippase family protein [Vibrio cholerae]EKF9407411.1 oligosaccharide flippase family protein [Vibrio cholerae]